MFSLIIIIIMVFSLESGLLFLIIVVFYLCHFKLPEHQKHKAYEKNISTNSWKMYYFAALEAEIFYFRWIDVYVSKFSVSNYLLHILFVIQVCKNFWYSRIFGMNILTKSAQCVRSSSNNEKCGVCGIDTNSVFDTSLLEKMFGLNFWYSKWFSKFLLYCHRVHLLKG